MSSLKDSTEFLGRKNPKSKFRVASKFPGRLKSLNRPVPHIREETLPPDTPQSQFITTKQ